MDFIWDGDLYKVSSCVLQECPPIYLSPDVMCGTCDQFTAGENGVLCLDGGEGIFFLKGIKEKKK